jgi:hypothetical protein
VIGVSSAVVTESSTLTGASLTGVIVTSTVAVAELPAVSVIV